MPRITFLFGLLFLLSWSSLAQEKVLEPLKVSQIRGINVFGKPVDNQTRCVHWHSELDIIAIKFKCCDKYYPCFSCHEEEADHEHQVWPKTEFNQKAILCGVCGNELGIQEYMDSNNTCPHCKSSFNPGCSKHYHLYFETEPKK
ncbi:putative CHY-type Zn-finger protein [Algoriphagus boseongensis]|uniref:Putative CHY-type Zn-finger protein n=1 Tax=Algoriphagus boseongensis TaxID=1442587 RepID=A0A4R6T703_9BACT|nr:CHY zinc finger protein [Algoriphagus boseongensis]TDQ18948.1 putative CHY-type Zn-finger protein [Algoriphagus boseongensis]